MEYVKIGFIYLGLIYFSIVAIGSFASVFIKIHKINNQYYGFILAGLISSFTATILYIYQNILILILGFIVLVITKKIFGNEPTVDPSKVNSDDKNLINDVISRAIELADKYKYEEALKTINELLDAHPTILNAMSTKANILNRMHKYKEAIIVCENILEVEPDNETTQLYKATALTNLNNFLDALKHIDNIISRNPSNIHAIKLKSRCHYRLYEKLNMTHKMPNYTVGEISQISAENLYDEAMIKLKD